MTQSLNDFFRDKKQRSDTETAGIDWAARKAEWINAVEQVYEFIQSSLGDSIKQGLVEIIRREKRIAESHLGIYLINELVVLVGDEEIIFSPKGRNIVGGQGRIDVRGESGEGMLILQPGPRWCIVTSKYPNLKLIEFNDETLGELLRGIARK